MTHPCAWASEKGRELKLTCPERVTLWQLAERAASRGYCWPSITQLMVDTGLARATVIVVLRSLAAKALIEIEKVGKQGHNYRVLQPVQNQTGDRFKSRPVEGGEPVQNQTGDRSKTEPVTGSKTASNRFKIATQTGSNLNPNLKENHKLTIAREDAREPETEVSSFGNEGKQAAPPQPEPSPKAPVIGTTNGGGQLAYREPGQPDPFGDWLAKGTPASHPGRPAPLATPEPDTITEDDPPQTEADRARMAAQLAQLAQDLGRSKRHFALLPGAQRSPSDQQDGLGTPRPRAAPLSAEQLAAARRSAGIPVVANA